jgi:hypothetical protein
MYSSIRARQSFFRSDRGLLDALLERELPNRYPSWDTVDRLWDDAYAEYALLRAAEIDTAAVEGELTCLNRVLDHLMNRELDNLMSEAADDGRTEEGEDL